MQYIDANAATTDIADNCGANQLSSNVNFSNANLVLQQQASAASSLAVCLTSPSYEPQPCTSASSWSMTCPVTPRPSNAMAPCCPCSANSAMQNRSRTQRQPLGHGRTSMLGHLCMITTGSFGLFLKEHKCTMRARACCTGE